MSQESGKSIAPWLVLATGLAIFYWLYMHGKREWEYGRIRQRHVEEEAPPETNSPSLTDASQLATDATAPRARVRRRGNEAGRR